MYLLSLLTTSSSPFCVIVVALFSAKKQVFTTVSLTSAVNSPPSPSEKFKIVFIPEPNLILFLGEEKKNF